MRSLLAICVVVFAILLQNNNVYATNGSDTLKVHTDYPVLDKNKKMQQYIYCITDKPFMAIVQIDCYQYTSETDSILVLKKHNLKFSIKNGTNKIKIDYDKSDSDTKYSLPYFQVLERSGSIAPGFYKTVVRITDTFTHQRYSSVFLHDVDSLLKPGSSLRADVNKSMTPKSRSFLGMRLKRGADKVKAYHIGNAMENAQKKIGKAARERGLKQVQYQKNGGSYVDFYYENWFAGRYEVSNTKSLEGQLQQQEDLASAINPNKLATNDLNAHPSLFSQFKTFKKLKEDNQEVKGEIGLSTNISTGQEQYSAVDNNYYEVKGRLEVPIFNIPIELEGLYTSQDNNRSIKSSYIRVHYDVSKAKDELKQFIGAYNQKFAETKSKGVGMEQIYQKGISTLESRKAKLLSELKTESITKGNTDKSTLSDLKKEAMDTTGVQQSFSGTVDSANNTGKAAEKAKKNKAKVEADEKKIREKYKQIEELDKKIEKYKGLLAQNRNTNYFDSALAYSKSKELRYQNDASYKELTKSAAGLLPDGSVKKFITGVTTMDAGMFPKYASKYTMSGQMLKGIDFGYDFGFCEAGITAGKTEYIGRDGTMDKYTCYSAKTSFKIFEAQKIGVVYYGYTSDRKLYSGDAFFKNMNVTTPTFYQPTHIFSVNYESVIAKIVTINAEGATTIKKFIVTEGKPNTKTDDKMAWHFDADGSIPKTSVQLTASFDKTGKNFENNTLPITLKGTEQYKIGGSSDFLKSLLTVGIDYNYLIQNNLNSTASNTKWGFDIKTHSKRYPSVSMSYKPFSTFRSYNDTLNIPQHPLIGSVWTSKVSYQFKRQGKSVRLSLLYNRCLTTMDTSIYGNSLMQLMCLYLEKQFSSSVSIGQMTQSGTNATSSTIPNDMKFINIAASYSLNKTVSISGGQDIGFAPFGFCRYSLNGGIGCRFQKKPVTLRISMRYNTYQLNSAESWKQLCSGNIDLTYRFKTKVVKNNSI